MNIRLHGGHGNQLFQIAFGLSHGFKSFDVSSFDNDTLRHYEMDQWELPIELVKDPNAICAYWQDERFFDKKLVRELFAHPKGNPNPACMDMADKILDAKDSCFIGVRRADYLWPERINYHGVLPFRYYYEAVGSLPVIWDGPKTQFFIFTDDTPWAKDNLEQYGDIVDVNGPNEKAWDIWLMSLCKHAIIANSTFHWWGAWLQNDTGTVIAPKKWFADEKVNAECTIVPERWIRV